MVRYVLEQILSGEATEVVVERIHEYLTNVGEDVRAGKIKLDDFIIFKVRLVPSVFCATILTSYYRGWGRTLRTIPTLRANLTYKSRSA